MYYFNKDLTESIRVNFMYTILNCILFALFASKIINLFYCMLH
jgi:hypothetical protein